MGKFKTTIRLNTGKVIIEETEEKTLEDCKKYWNNYIKYWGKVHSNWNYAIILKIEENDGENQNKEILANILNNILFDKIQYKDDDTIKLIYDRTIQYNEVINDIECCADKSINDFIKQQKEAKRMVNDWVYEK